MMRLVRRRLNASNAEQTHRHAPTLSCGQSVLESRVARSHAGPLNHTTNMGHPRAGTCTSPGIRPTSPTAVKKWAGKAWESSPFVLTPGYTLFMIIQRHKGRRPAHRIPRFTTQTVRGILSSTQLKECDRVSPDQPSSKDKKELAGGRRSKM